MQTFKTIGVALGGVVVGLLLAGAFQNDALQGVYNNVSNDFSEGITVDGTSVIDGDGDVWANTITYVETTESITADNTLTLAEGGKTFYINTSVSTTTLPAVATATGTVYRFAIASAVATNDFRVVSAEGDNIEGSLIVAGAVVDCDAADRINFVTSTENLGDFAEVRSDGQKWFVTQSNALSSGAITCSG